MLLVPGECGWEIWTGQTDSEFTLHATTTTDRAADLSAIPSGELLLLFPIKAVTALPLRVTSEDPSLFPDLASLHAERLGLRPDPMAGQLADVFIVSREAENSTLLSVQLRVPADGDLPPRGPKSFDLSARAYPLAGDTLTIWKEFGRWVFAISHQGNLLYCQATTGTSHSPDPALAREIRIAFMQLAMQSLEVEPTRVLIWTHAQDCDPSAITDAFGIAVEISSRPAPVLPQPLSKLLPADVRAARREALRRRNILLGIAAVALVYLGVIGWFGYGLWKDNQETVALIQQAIDAAPEGDAYLLHIAKWDELANAIDLKNSPVDILSRVASCIPPNSGLRLKSADITASELTLIGEAPLFQAANTFNLNLEKNNDLVQFKWQVPEPSQSTRGWEFRYIGEIPVSQ